MFSEAGYHSKTLSHCFDASEWTCRLLTWWSSSIDRRPCECLPRNLKSKLQLLSLPISGEKSVKWSWGGKRRTVHSGSLVQFFQDSLQLVHRNKLLEHLEYCHDPNVIYWKRQEVRLLMGQWLSWEFTYEVYILDLSAPELTTTVK